jgi:4-amino-4-deoxy-L-arabinose transferase-like glycosyltransferase
MRLLRPSGLLCLWIVFYAVLIGATLHNTYPYQGDEAFYTVSALAMVQDGQYLVPYYFGQPRFQKPILMYWLIAASYKAFGISLWSARMPALLVACLTLLLVYRLATLYVPDGRFGLFAAVLLSSTVMFMTFARIAMTDPLLAFFTTAALWCFASAVRHPERRFLYHLCGYGAVALAFMSKGPAGLLALAGYGLFLLVMRPAGYKNLLISLGNPLHILLFALIVGPWYGYIYLAHHTDMMRHMGRESKAFTSGMPLLAFGLNLLFYLYVMLVFFVPFSAIALVKMFRKTWRIPPELMLPVIYIATVVLFFTFFVPEHKDRYLCIIFPALAILVAYILYRTGPLQRYTVAAAVVAVCIGTVLIIYPILPGEALRQVVVAWKQRHDGSLGLYKLETKRTGWALLMAGGQARVNSYDADYVITDDSGKADLAGFTSLLAVPERERLRWENGRPVIMSRTYHLLRRVVP